MASRSGRTILIAAGFLMGFSAGSDTLRMSEFEGRPVFAEGVDLGYYVWMEGDTWKVRWTTQGQKRHFTGSVIAEGGDLKSLKRIDVESESRVLYPGRPARVVVGPRGNARVRRGRRPVVAERVQDKIAKDGDSRIVFSSQAVGDLDGFDFKLGKNVTALRFMLEVENRAMPNRVEVGRDNRHPNSLPLVVEIH